MASKSKRSRPAADEAGSDGAAQTLRAEAAHLPQAQPEAVPASEKMSGLGRLLGASPATQAQVCRDFFASHWEQQPLHVAGALAAPAAAALFGADTLLADADADGMDGMDGASSMGPFVYGMHLNVVGCPDGKSKQVMHEPGAPVTAASLRAHLSESTMQFFQPQRFDDALWQLMAQLEAEFSCLWGANLYVTPPGTQGLAPHYDDVDVFVLQTRGCKRWSLHSSLDPFDELALLYSEDLGDNIGPKTHELVMRPGDLLYLPRGTIHYAVAEGDAPSEHITLSTSQKHTYFDFMRAQSARLLDAAASRDKGFRYGLPVGFLGSCGTLAHLRGQSDAGMRAKLAALFRNVAAQLESDADDSPESVPRAFREAVDDFGGDFAAARLPPPPVAAAAAVWTDAEAALPERLVLVNPCLLHVSLASTDEDDEEEEEQEEEDMGQGDQDDDVEEVAPKEEKDADEVNALDEDEGVLVVRYCAHNSRVRHMGSLDERGSNGAGEGDAAVQVGSSEAPALGALLKSWPAAVRTESLPSSEARDSVLRSLLAAGVLLPFQEKE